MNEPDEAARQRQQAVETSLAAWRHMDVVVEAFCLETGMSRDEAVRAMTLTTLGSMHHTLAAIFAEMTK